MIELLITWLLQLLLPPSTTEQVAQSATSTATVVRVIDGDTIDVRVGGVEERVRYIGIDTPEPYAGTAPECYAAEATAANRALTKSGVVTLVRDTENRDTYNRLLRYVYVDDTFVNEQLVERGFARPLPIPPNMRFASNISLAAQTAQRDARGLWGACN
ncbi:MAG TPA: thermonuclease family protein [Candidatus Paceibacterota bacterium]|nr:thermonuclease family protein [Candidatus Paceibacterota bacterium]